MNDRLGELFGNDSGDVPSWAVDGDTNNNDNGSAPMVSNTTSSSPDRDKQQQADEHDWAASNKEEGDIEFGVQQQQQPKYMESFFKDVDAIKADVDAIRDATKRVGEINEEAIKATTTSKEEELSRLLKPLIDKTNKRAKRTKNLLALLKEENQNLKNDKEVKASDMRIRENLCNTLTRKFIDEMKLYQNAQQKYKNDIKKKVKRQVQIVQPDATDEEIDAVIRSEGGREALYKEKILAGRVADPIKNAYATVAGKYQDVLTLEASVAELHQMFLDFALLTEQQGELLDQIEFQVKSAGEYVEQANEEVVEAIEISKRVRKKQCIIIAIVMVIAIIIAIWLITNFS
mmetsp:Transcript_14883/g.21241  ORF Transcript_14883/g.21241 Transcript_14883/m.21241 type:complete len:346 (-) Transcript_14883:281-1318(-)|eukprot:CAMPEP_0172428352 /NCGR_PEP_ID=MMETSP1064-20121228/45999_1 /TAXON_ID=202472 /ORGANISM="Aulacoseira subarctica , Strain CCAP 1002/5" /LENGTH=345 /DNA_ID=CAMNT_0013173091 /DNA_START=141 /DNA_END=1178 /DNA_ORIENTATION=-